MTKQFIIRIKNKWRQSDNDFFKMERKDFVAKWNKIAKENKRKQVPIEETLLLLSHELKEVELHATLKHDLIQKEQELIEEKSKEKLQDLTQNFEKYVQKEKQKLSEKRFQKIDRFRASIAKVLHQIQMLNS